MVTKSVLDQTTTLLTHPNSQGVRLLCRRKGCRHTSQCTHHCRLKELVVTISGKSISISSTGASTLASLSMLILMSALYQLSSPSVLVLVRAVASTDRASVIASCHASYGQCLVARNKPKQKFKVNTLISCSTTLIKYG